MISNAQPEPNLVRINQFVQKFEGFTAGQLRWQIHNGEHNGLERSGAIVRVRTRPTSKRPVLFVDVPRYFDWLRGNQSQAAA